MTSLDLLEIGAQILEALRSSASPQQLDPLLRQRQAGLETICPGEVPPGVGQLLQQQDEQIMTAAVALQRHQRRHGRYQQQAPQGRQYYDLVR